MANRRLRLIQCREAVGTRDQVAAKLQISIVYLRMIETGAHNPGRDLMIRISNLLGEPVETLFPDLFGGDQVI